MLTTRHYGVSTHVVHGQRLGREHLREIAAHGFEAVELFATRTHFDYHNPATIADLGGWLAESGLVLHAVHAPVVESVVGRRWGPAINIATADPAARAAALRETELALQIARRIPTRFFVLHLGLPTSQHPAPDDNSRHAALKSIAALQAPAASLGVRLAVEVIPNSLSQAASLVHAIEHDLELPDVGICLDFGHAHLGGDLLDAIEVISGHLATTHVHDNRGRNDDHLVPFEGTIEWDGALLALQKVGYDGMLMFEVDGAGPLRDVLKRARDARARFERIFGA